MSAHNDRATVLAIDSEPAILRLLQLELAARGYHILTCSRVEEGMELVVTGRPDVVLLDLNASTVELLRRIKSEASVPVVALSAGAEEAARREALELGADDFIAKPFLPSRVSEAIELLIAKSRGVEVSSVLTSGNLRFDIRRRVVLRSEAPINLTRSEWQLIEQLAASPGEPILNQELLTRVWGPDYRDDIEYLRLYVRRLRSKLGDDTREPRVILPYLDVGYSLNASTS